MKRKKIKEVYFVENVDRIINDEGENLLMCSTKNWNYYFTKLNKKSKAVTKFFEKIENLSLLEFSSEKEMFNYLENKDSRRVVDWSIEHNKPLVLEFDKI